MAKRAAVPAIIGGLFLSSPSYADLKLQFFEGAPKDRFVVTNIGSCDIEAAQVEIDFAASKAGLIFDVTGSGAGVEVFQPFEVTQGALLLADQPSISDGDQRVTLNMTGRATTQSIAFTIDVDNTAGTREITFADSEMSGTTVSLSVADKIYSAVMETGAQVTLETPDCAL
ncbi:MAG: aggregation factor core [Shimia sp.]|uniref:aggregation factor core n=1 Tax=Shimia sp. TaxID=1954381 RepID=UPI0040590134